MEALAIIGSRAACTQLTNYGVNLAISAAGLSGELRSAPDSIKGLMEDVEGYLVMLRSLSLESRNSGGNVALQARIDRCTSSAMQLQGMLKQMSFRGNDSKLIRFKKALAFQQKAKTIDKCLVDLESTRGSLSLHIFKLLVRRDGPRISTPVLERGRFHTFHAGQIRQLSQDHHNERGTK